jgi:hypothetical protein
VPSDIASSLQQQHSSSPPSSSHLAQWWVASYWFSFISQVFILPLHMEYTRSGEFTIKDRLLASLRYNFFYYLILLVIGFGGIIVLMASGSLKASNVVGFAIAFSNAYGLAAAIFLMGYGLVAIPKELWKRADAGGERLRLYHYAGLQAERVQGAHKRLSAAVLMARKASALFGKSDPLRKYMDMVVELAASVGDNFKFSVTSVPEGAELDFFDKSDLARLRRHLKSSLKDYEREKALYVEAVERYLKLQERAARADVAMKPADDAPLMDKMTWFRDSWQLHYWAYRLVAIAATAASIAVVVAETTVSASLPDSSIVSLSLRAAAMPGRFHSFFLVQFLSSGFLAYPVYCAYYSLYKMGQVAFYRLVPRHTDAYSLCYSGFLMTRFAAPLAFNFLAAIALPTKKGETVGAGGSLPDVTSTVFYHEFGELMSRQPLIGWQFTTFAPAALGPYVLLLAIGFFDPLVKTVGTMLQTLFGSSSGVGIEEAAVNIQFEDDFELRSGYADAGRRLLVIEAENARMMMRMGNSSSSSGVVPIGHTVEPVSGETLESLECQGLLDLVEEKQPWFQRVFPSKFVDRINNNSSTSGIGGGRNNNNNNNNNNKRRDGRQRAPEVEEARSRLSRTVGEDQSGISSNIIGVASSSSMTASLLLNDSLNDDDDDDNNYGGGGLFGFVGLKRVGWRNMFLGDK